MSTKILSNDPNQQWEAITNFGTEKETSFFLNQISIEPVEGAEENNPYKILLSINDDEYNTIVNLPITIEDAQILHDWVEHAIIKARAIEIEDENKKGGQQ